MVNSRLIAHNSQLFSLPCQAKNKLLSPEDFYLFCYFGDCNKYYFTHTKRKMFFT